MTGIGAQIAGAVTAGWRTPGVSEFLSAALGGGMTLWAQRWALRHDREKEEARRIDRQKAVAWGIYFKISSVYEALYNAAQDIRSARKIADEKHCELWQVLNPVVHDPRPEEWTTEELVFLLGHREFGLVQKYREAIVWLWNLAQALGGFREMRVPFQMETPADIGDGTSGSFTLTPENRRSIMPKIALLRSLTSSLEAVVLAQEPDARKLLQDYAAAMKRMIGEAPSIEFR